MAIVQPAPAPYRISAFNELSRQPGIELAVYYLQERAWPHGWEVDHSRAAFTHDVADGAGFLWRPEMTLLRKLRQWQPDVTILGGWDRLAYHVVMAMRRYLGSRVVVWTATVEATNPSRFRDSLKRWLLRRADGVLTVSTPALDYYRRLVKGATRRSAVVLNPVDNTRFRTTPPNDQRHRRPSFLYVGRLDPGKGLEDLISAWHLSGLDDRGSLVLAGDGSQRQRLESLSTRLGLHNVSFLGLIPYDLLPELYSSSEAFVFPSRSDTWGMVLNEAMAAGLPIITTSAAGAVGDLVRHGVNGLVVPAAAPQQLASAIQTLASDQDLGRRMGKESLRLIESATPERWAEQVRFFIREVTGT